MSSPHANSWSGKASDAICLDATKTSGVDDDDEDAGVGLLLAAVCCVVVEVLLDVDVMVRAVVAVLDVFVVAVVVLIVFVFVVVVVVSCVVVGSSNRCVSYCLFRLSNTIIPIFQNRFCSNNFCFDKTYTYGKLELLSTRG